MLLDLWLKRIWFVIGCLILLAVLAGCIFFVANLFTARDHTGPLIGRTALPQGRDSLVTQDLTFDFPRPIGHTGLLSVAVYVKDLSATIPRAELSLSRYSTEEYADRGMVNIMFVKADGSSSRALLETRAYIKRADIPEESDSLQKFNLYDISFEDTDHDGRITARDSSRFYISDPDGRNLAPLIGSADDLVSYSKSKDRKVIYLLLRHRAAMSKAEDWPERLYIFDVAARTLTPIPKENQTIDQMRRALWSK